MAFFLLEKLVVSDILLLQQGPQPPVMKGKPVDSTTSTYTFHIQRVCLILIIFILSEKKTDLPVGHSFNLITAAITLAYAKYTKSCLVNPLTRHGIKKPATNTKER